MDNNDIYRQLKFEGFFSEYLPQCFSVKNNTFYNIPGENCDVIDPYSFNMSKFNGKGDRRKIYIPEIGSYAVLMDYIKNNKILDQLIKFNNDNASNSYSPIKSDEDKLLRHEETYNSENKEEAISSSYIDIVIQKIIKSAGATKLLKLDIANCYSSVYTHFLPSILLGYEDANILYKNTVNNNANATQFDAEKITIYNNYVKLDKLIRNMNSKRTNGLLTGPLISSVLVEALLTRIDIELIEKHILFSRYVDDYEIYIHSNSYNEEHIIKIFTEILGKYGLSLNAEKTEIKEFPFYVMENFDKIINIYRKNSNSDYDIVELFNKFILMEKEGTKGAVRYLIKSLEANPIDFNNKELVSSYLMSILTNDDRTLLKSCSYIINQKNDYTEITSKIKELLIYYIDKGLDLEVVWLTYVLIETDSITLDDEVVGKIIEGNNELAILMLIRKQKISNNNLQFISQKSFSWLLNYELYAHDILNIDQISERLNLNRNKEMYKKMKENDVHFCYNK